VLATDDPSCRAICHPAAPAERVAIIIPTKNKVELLRQCLRSLQATVPASLADICVVDHQSDEPEARAYLQSLPPDIRVLPYEGIFNFSSINNHAVARLGRGADHYLFLNNDTEALAPGWLEHMLGLARRPDVGAVGALLLYGNRTVQHAGVQVGMHYAADHAPKGMPAFAADGRRLPGPQGTLLAVRDQSAVTAACVLVPARAFHEVGGFDEGFAVGFGDIDLCLRLRQRAYKILIDPQAVLLHHESASRGSGKLDPHPLDSIRFRDRWWDVILRGDLFHSPLHSRYAPYQLKPCIWNRDRLVARTLPVQLPHRSGSLERPAA
jgi:GT2 family glycosyltransferase